MARLKGFSKLALLVYTDFVNQEQWNNKKHFTQTLIPTHLRPSSDTFRETER